MLGKGSQLLSAAFTSENWNRVCCGPAPEIGELAPPRRAQSLLVKLRVVGGG